MTQAIRNVFQSSGITQYNETINLTGGTDIFFCFNGVSYRAELDLLNMKVKLLKMNLVRNCKKAPYYHYVTSFFGKDTWFLLIDYVKRRVA